VPVEVWCLPIGVVIASIAMSIGIGGGILWMPVLILIFGVSPQQAVATSLFIQAIGLGSGTVGYSRGGLIRWRLVLIFTAVSIPTVVLGSLMAVKLPTESIELTLGIMSLALALLFVVRRDDIIISAERAFNRSAVNKILPVAAVFGVICGFLSIGIGEWIIPSLRKRLKLSMSQSVATVVPLMFFLVIVGTFTHGILTKNILWNYALYSAVGVMIGGQIGSRVAPRINDRALKEAFIYFMTLVGIHMLFQAI